VAAADPNQTMFLNILHVCKFTCLHLFQDAHSCLMDFDVDTNTSLFAVYDGHGGIIRIIPITLPQE